MKLHSKKLIAVPLLVTGLLGGVSQVIISTPTAYAATQNVYDDFLNSNYYKTFVNYDKSGLFGNWREGAY
ncbi:hypothetical protein CSW12_31280 (plasmid) [Bacillus cereus]|uniref:hypothetical protein n=1 Tax=Bacillus cereus TaxID=1396 RepID=UPI000C2CF907|nr:hypothetical protein [Bacillus cereus]AUB67192.1 hypothetical protein CSW12_30605 [Bacillus cereus]AUB67303.1 hypothetical protein CSW12_31280 [Bacillus cereus]